MKRKHFRYFWDTANLKPMRFDFKKNKSQRFSLNEWQDSILGLGFLFGYPLITRAQVRNFIKNGTKPFDK